ncbi:MAG: hypothetical protein U0587_15370 [Candidatus Binatia bacterium]
MPPAPAAGPGVCLPPGSPCTYTYSWALTSITDPNNTLLIDYQKVSNILYPTTISYGGNSATGLGVVYDVHFLWLALPSADQVVTSIGGVAAQLTQRLSKIEVRYPAGSTNPADRIRYYTFNYDDDQYLFPIARYGRRSFLYGSVNHFLDSTTDIAANVFGMAAGYSKLTGSASVLSTRAAEWGNYIPGPGEPNPAFGGAGRYKGNPSDAWGQYP